MVVLGIWDVTVYLNHTSSYEEKLILITKYFEVFSRKINRDSVIKAYDYL
jgi:hypothetical protein